MLWTMRSGPPWHLTRHRVRIALTAPLLLTARLMLTAAVFALACASPEPTDEPGPETHHAYLVDEGPLFRRVQVMAPKPIPSAPEAKSAARRYFDVDSPPPACEQPPAASFTREACPTLEPEGDCALEGLECRYLQDASCASLHECVYGIWMYLGKQCLGEPETPQRLAGTEVCPERAPIPDSPCSEDQQQCGYQVCAIGSWPRLEFTCACGRWSLAERQCPVD